MHANDGLAGEAFRQPQPSAGLGILMLQRIAKLPCILP